MGSKIIENIKNELEKYKLETNAIVLNAEILIIYLQKEQLKAGATADGEVIDPDYEEKYGEYKESLDSYQLDGNVPDLFVSGDFYESIKAEILGEKVIILSDNSEDYFVKLSEKYGNIIGLGEYSKNELKKHIFEDILKISSEIFH